MPSPSYRIEPLQKQHDRKGFSCGQPSLDDYLHRQVSQDKRRYATAAYVIVADESPKICGYYTLAALSLDPGQLPENIIKKLPRYPAIPVTLLGRLAVDQTYQGQGLGELLLLNALELSLSQADTIGSVGVVVDAIDDNTKRFYEHFGFIPLMDYKERLFILMKTIKQLFH